MAVNYSLAGVAVPGVQVTWNRVPIRTNNDGTIAYSLWLDHTWRLANLEIGIWDALQALEGSRIISMESNHIEAINTPILYDDVIFESITGTQRGHVMLDVNIKLSVKSEIVNLWWRTPGLNENQYLVAYQPKGASTFESSLINLVNPGVNDAALGVAPAFNTSVGWTFDGATQFLDTQLLVNLTYSMFIRVDYVQPLIDGGFNFSGGPQFFIGHLLTGGTNFFGYQYEETNITFDDVTGLGTAFVLAIYNGIGLVRATRDGVSKGSTGPHTDIGIRNIFVGASEATVGGAESFMPGNVIAFSLYEGELTARQASDISANMEAL